MPLGLTVPSSAQSPAAASRSRPFAAPAMPDPGHRSTSSMPPSLSTTSPHQVPHNYVNLLVAILVGGLCRAVALVLHHAKDKAHFSTKVEQRQIRARTSSQKALKRGCICCMNGYEWSKDWDAYPTHQASKTWTSLCTSKPELCKQGKHPAGGAPAQGSAQGAPRTLAAGIGAEAALGGPSQRTIAASKITRRRAKNYQYQRQNRRKLCRAVSIPGKLPDDMESQFLGIKVEI